jgi:Methyltransferase domain
VRSLLQPARIVQRQSGSVSDMLPWATIWIIILLQLLESSYHTSTVFAQNTVTVSRAGRGGGGNGDHSKAVHPEEDNNAKVKRKRERHGYNRQNQQGGGSRSSNSSSRAPKLAAPTISVFVPASSTPQVPVAADLFDAHLKALGCSNGLESIHGIYNASRDHMYARYYWGINANQPRLPEVTRRRDLPYILGGPYEENICRDGLETIGGSSDGGKRACGLINRSRTPNEQCIVFAIGSYNEWSFEESIFDQTGCIVHSFDCTLRATGGIKVPSRISSRVFGHDICLGAKDESKQGMDFRSWSSLLKIADISSAPTFLKMDIEGTLGSSYYLLSPAHYHQTQSNYHSITIIM